MLAGLPVSPAAPVGRLGPVPEAFRHLEVKPLGEGIGDRKAGPVPFPPIKAECGWLREAHDTGGKDFDQPQWNLTTLCATFMEDGHELAHQFGNQHPEYDYDSTEEIWNRKNREREAKNIGYPQCKTISDNGSNSFFKRVIFFGVVRVYVDVKPQCPQRQCIVSVAFAGIELLPGEAKINVVIGRGLDVGYDAEHILQRLAGPAVEAVSFQMPVDRCIALRPRNYGL
jgi:hypothetical protein